MSTNQSYFELHDLVDELPDPGFYPGCVERARFRQSANHNRMLEVLHTLEDVGPTYQTVCDYFVLEGEHVSASGLFLARRRLQFTRFFGEKSSNFNSLRTSRYFRH